MAKINLLTMHYCKNNGAFLQTYATLQILRSLGHEVTLIDLQKPFPHDLRWWIEYPTQRHYERLRKKFYGQSTSRLYRIEAQKLPVSDYTVSGSDQIWNPDITGEDALHYFLDFAPENSRRVSLASSFGKKSWNAPDGMTAKVREELQKFAAVSVREESGVEICRQWGIRAEQIPDPTLVWQDYTPISGKIPERQCIVCFAFRFNELFVQTAQALQKQTGLPVEVINVNMLTRQRPAWMNNFSYGHLSGCTTPDYWLRKICGAAYVVTDSFHANAFSIKSRRRFITLCADPAKFERIRQLLKRYGLEHHMVLTPDDVTPDLSRKAADYDVAFLERQIKMQQDCYYAFIAKNIH